MLYVQCEVRVCVRGCVRSSVKSKFPYPAAIHTEDFSSATILQGRSFVTHVCVCVWRVCTSACMCCVCMFLCLILNSHTPQRYTQASLFTTLALAVCLTSQTENIITQANEERMRGANE